MTATPAPKRRMTPAELRVEAIRRLTATVDGLVLFYEDIAREEAQGFDCSGYRRYADTQWAIYAPLLAAVRAVGRTTPTH